MLVIDTAEQERRRKDTFFELRANILALVGELRMEEAVEVLASSMNEVVAPFGYGSTATLHCLASFEAASKE